MNFTLIELHIMSGLGGFHLISPEHIVVDQ